MSRKSRKISSNGIYHIMLRGINRQTIFEDDEDRLRFLTTVKRFKEVSQFNIYSYCLMDNHIHLLLREIDEPVSKAIQRISASYVYWYNQKYERCGHLFQERFKSENVETMPYFFRVVRYIHHNPVKAGLANNVFECKWTSIAEYLGQSQDGLVDIDLVLDLLSPNKSKAIQLFIDYIQISTDDHCLDDNVKVRILDSEVRSHLMKLGITTSSELQQLNMEKRNQIILELKKMHGVSVRQLSRITGISKSVIDRVR
ncbi:transposase [Aquibacillus salsiterrae]|uniref:Transposase n=1 Tax=Aquibacillus salsiterrae TaxID=2950439 RepID=A0A9X3WH50_9BACI|nr:transposase [Aquibacillus salsiterrae]MDC3418326.1 transposase [Aquibacillus salsiterrae]